MSDVDQVKSKLDAVKKKQREFELEEARITERLTSITQSLQKEFGVSSIDEAKAKEAELSREVTTLEADLAEAEKTLDLILQSVS